MSHKRALLLAGCLGALAAIPAEAQFHEIYGRRYQFGGLTSVSSTRGPGAVASGFFIDGLPQGVLLKILSTGTLDWVRAYGPTQLSAVRENPAGGFVWIGTGEVVQPRGFAPVVAGVDPLGAVLWSRRIRLVLPDGTPALQSYGLFLEIDPKDGGYWVGGNLWLRALDDPQPWLGKLDSAGNLLWAKTLSFTANARLFSIFPALDGGILGVGQTWAQDDPGRAHSGMLAIKLGAGGDFVWGFGYQVDNTEVISEQWLADVDRDPRFTRPESVVVGTVIGFCKSIPSAPCDPVQSAALVATLDETTGKLSRAFGLFSASQTKTFGETIVMDLVGETTAVGGEIRGEGAGSQKGFLALLLPGPDVIRQAAIHGAGAGFDAEVRSLDRWPGGSGQGYVFAMNETYAAPGPLPAWLRSVVRTDRDGNSGACEHCIGLRTFEARIFEGDVKPELYAGAVEPFPVQAAPFTLVQESCGARSCGDPSPGSR